jgi:putative membrane protein
MRGVTFLVKVIVNAMAIWVAAWILDGVVVKGDSDLDTLLTYALVGVIFGVINTFIKPVIKVLAFPFYVLTLGLLAFVVNAFMLQLTEWISDWLGLGFVIDEFWWTAIWAAIIVTLVSMILNAVVDRD